MVRVPNPSSCSPHCSVPSRVKVTSSLNSPSASPSISVPAGLKCQVTEVGTRGLWRGLTRHRRSKESPKVMDGVRDEADTEKEDSR